MHSIIFASTQAVATEAHTYTVSHMVWGGNVRCPFVNRTNSHTIFVAPGLDQVHTCSHAERSSLRNVFRPADEGTWLELKKTGGAWGA